MPEKNLLLGVFCLFLVQINLEVHALMHESAHEKVLPPQGFKIKGWIALSKTAVRDTTVKPKQFIRLKNQPGASRLKTPLAHQTHQGEHLCCAPAHHAAPAC